MLFAKNLIRKLTVSQSPVNPDSLKKILLVKLYDIGDCLNATPLIRGLRTLLPDAEIDVLVGNASARIFRGNPYISQVITIEDEAYRKPDPQALYELSRTIRASVYDASIVAHRSPKLGAFLASAKIPIRIGLDLDCNGYLLTHPIGEETDQHEINIYNNLIVPLLAGLNREMRMSFEFNPVRMDFFPTVSDYDTVDKLWHDNFPGNDVIGLLPCVDFFPGDELPQKIWSHYADLAQIILEHNLRVAYFGNDSSGDIDNTLPKNRYAVSFINNPELGVVSELMNRCRLIVAHDSPCLQLAATTDVPILSIFGPTNYKHKAPLGDKHSSLRPDLECVPCYHHHKWKKDCEIHCIDSITPERVWVNIKYLLSD